MFAVLCLRRISVMYMYTRMTIGAQLVWCVWGLLVLQCVHVVAETYPIQLHALVLLYTLCV